MQGDRRSQCWGCELEAKTGASQQGRAGHQWSCASVASQLHRSRKHCWSCSLVPPLGGPWLSTGGTASALLLSAGLGQLHFLQITQNLRGTRLLYDCMTSRGDTRFFPSIPCSILYGEQATHVGMWRGVTFSQSNAAKLFRVFSFQLSPQTNFTIMQTQDLCS